MAHCESFQGCDTVLQPIYIHILSFLFKANLAHCKWTIFSRPESLTIYRTSSITNESFLSRTAILGKKTLALPLAATVVKEAVVFKLSSHQTSNAPLYSSKPVIMSS